MFFNLQVMLVVFSVVVVEQVTCRECIVHKEIGSIKQNLELARYKHGNCSLVEFAAFIQSDKIGGFIELKNGRVSNLMSQCVSNNPYSYLYIQFDCGVVDFEFIKRNSKEVVMSRLRFGYYETEKHNFITYGKVDWNQHLGANTSYECAEDKVYESKPCVKGSNCIRLHLQQVQVEPFRLTNSSDFSFDNIHKCRKIEKDEETLHDMKQD